MNRFFSFDGEGYRTHSTAEEARHECQVAIDFWGQDGEWAEEVEFVCWGEIRERATERLDEPHLPTCDDDACDEDCQYGVNYLLEPLDAVVVP